jgi:imidazoleglycerol phosphate dehydratase HisB
MKRLAVIRRKTRETNIVLRLDLDGRGRYRVNTSLPFLDHMFELFSKHSGFDLKVKSSGDTHIDDHHLVEDLALVLGAAINKALGDKRGITRYGQALIPMDESLSYVALDLSGRAHCEYKAKFQPGWRRFDTDLFEDFFRALANTAGMNLHIKMIKGRSNHHIAEAMFKAVARALSQAVSLDPRRPGIPSTKGVL